MNDRWTAERGNLVTGRTPSRFRNKRDDDKLQTGQSRGRTADDHIEIFPGAKSGIHSCNTRWTKEIAMEPSPTAEATRLTLPARTSPTANIPGRLVSSR